MMDYQLWSKADTHLHSTYSDGSSTPEELVEYVDRYTDLQVIAITDHDTIEGALVARSYAQRLCIDVDVIIGQEVTTEEGDVVGLFLNSTLPEFRTAADAVRAIHAQGGLAIAVHPFSYWATLTEMQGVGSRIISLPLDGVEVRNGFPTNFISNRFTGWINRRHGQGLTELGGSDSHYPYTIGQPFTWFTGTTAADLREAIRDSRTHAGGTLWKTASIARILPAVLRSGLPSMANRSGHADESGIS